MNIICFLLVAVGLLWVAAVFSPSLRARYRASLALTRRTYLLAAVWFLFGAAVVSSERHTDFSRPAEHGRLQQLRCIAAVMSIVAIGSYCWDMFRPRRSSPDHPA